MQVLGGLWFALVLILTTAALAAYGSFVEGVYEGLTFKLLLCGFFVNILFAALRRWPFQGRHTGFLLTHLGLLLIIAALFIKSTWGTQATLPLDMGKPENIAFIPEKLVVYLKDRSGNELYHPVSKEFTVNSVRFTPIRLYPHTKAELHFWHDGHKATVFGAGTIPFFEKMSDAEPLKMGNWKIYALKEADEIPPGTIVIKEKEIIARTMLGKLIRETEPPLYMFDQGWGGYGTSFTVEEETFYGPLIIDIVESNEGERALELLVDDKKIILQEGVAPLPVKGFMARLMPEPVTLPFSLTLEKAWKEGDFCHAKVIVGDEKLLIATREGAHYKGYDFYLSFWDPEHVSLVVSRDPLGQKLLFAGIGFISLGVILLLGRRKWSLPS